MKPSKERNSLTVKMQCSNPGFLKKTPNIQASPNTTHCTFYKLFSSIPKLHRTGNVGTKEVFTLAERKGKGERMLDIIMSQHRNNFSFRDMKLIWLSCKIQTFSF